MDKKANILIVDDESSFRKTLSQILERKGYATSTADNGQSAIELFKKRPFDVVLMDVRMPVMSGVEAYKKIKQICPSTTIIFMAEFIAQDLDLYVAGFLYVFLYIDAGIAEVGFCFLLGDHQV